MQNHNNGKPLSALLSENDQKPPYSSPRISFKSKSYNSGDEFGSPWNVAPSSTPSPSILYHCISALYRQEGTIFALAIAKGLVFTGSESCRIRAWRQPDCSERGFFLASCGNVRAILAHGNTIYTSHKDCKVRIWRIVSGPDGFKGKKAGVLPKPQQILGVIPVKSGLKHKDCISCMAMNLTEGLLYTGSWDRTIKVWRMSDDLCVDSFTAHEEQINAVVVNQNDGSVFSCSSDGTVKIWRRVYGQSTHALTMTLKFQFSPVNALALSCSSGSSLLYSGSSDGIINFWEKEKISGRYNHGGFLQGHRFSVLCLVAIDKLIFSGSEDTTIRVWRKEEGSGFHECLAVIDAHRGPVKSLAVALEMERVTFVGFLVYSAGLDQAFKAWRIKVSPEERMGFDSSDAKTKVAEYECEYEMSPVLSPAWVEKKLQGTQFLFD